MDINDEFHKDGKLADVTIVVEDHKILVSKTVLCLASPVFCAMFDGDFKEKKETEIPLPGKSYEDFVEFLRCIYPDKLKKITEKNVYMILPLAHEYNVGKIMKRCQKVLKQIVKNRHTENVEELYRHIHLSELYSLEELKEKCQYLSSEHTLKQFKAARTAHKISDASHYKIIELALRRRELDKTDEKVFGVQKTYMTYGQKLDRDKSTKGINCELFGRIFMEEECEEDVFRALRLIERFKITTDETTQLLNQLQTVNRNGECI